jgi:prepilin-type N-terminal cleavage/methylation domain-containing protein
VKSPTLHVKARCAFTLLELLIVVGIIALLMVLVAPAFTSIKSGTDVTSAAYTIKGVLDTARTYAKANNTYTWVGFFEENVSNPASPNADQPPVGRLIMSIVASKDGTTAYAPTNLTTIDPTKLIQVAKLIKVENVHLWTHTDTPSGAGSTFDTRRVRLLHWEFESARFRNSLSVSGGESRAFSAIHVCESNPIQPKGRGPDRQ